MTDPDPDPKPPDNRHEVAASFIETMISVAKGLGPQQFRAWLHGSIIAGFLVQVPDDFWHEMSKIEGCGKPGCDCHVASQEIHHALDLFRTEYKERVKKRDQARKQ